MALTDSMFLFEIKVEKLTSFINCREFCIRGQFADVFSINLKDPNESGTYIRSRTYKVKRKTRLRTVKASDKSPAAEVQAGQSVLVANNVDNLISNMTQYPMELSLWSKLVPDYKIGSTHIQWNETFLEYLKANHEKQNSVCVEGDYSVFDESTSKRMAVVKLTVKLTYMKEKTSMHSIVKEEPVTLVEDSCDSKAFYCTEKRRVGSFNENKSRIMNKEVKWKDYYDSSSKERVSEFETNEEGNIKIECKRFHSDNVNVVRSYTKADINVIKTKSCSSINKKMYDYIFGGRPAGPFGSQVYCVSYFTVEKDFADSPKSENTEKSPSDKSKTASEKSKTASDKSKSVSSRSKSPSEKSHTISENSKSDGALDEEKYKFRICKSDCPRKLAGNVSGTRSFCSLDLPLKATELITVKKCGRLDCGHRIMRRLPTPPDNRILLDLSSRRRDCCDATEKVEEVIGGMTAKLKFGSEPCYCECECQFGFIKKTTFCDICGGYEVFGDEYAKTPGYELPFPCPIFHKLADKNRLLKLSTSGSDTKRDKKEVSEPKKKEALEPKKEKKEAVEQKRDKKEPAETKKEKKDPKQKVAEKVIESEKDTTKKGKHKKKDERFKFNYGYSAPHIGHSRCMLPCAGTMTVVPKTMGWLWNAENIAGVKFRPQWKPGAANKHVVRLLKIAKNPGEVMAKRFRKKDSGKVKRPLKRPLLIVHKKEGEYTVTMETMKTYAKPRTFNQYPYEDKPLVTYTIGRTAEENLERKKKKERAQRRLERLQRDFVQSAFKDMCHEICLKTYQQALDILPDAEKPECPCYKADPEEMDSLSCSCSEDKELSESDTDSDEWIVEFTPPTATFDPSYKCKKVLTADISTQYSYLDYRVKLLDRYGNPVPRYFKGPDGKQQCSDLGGFWGPNQKWLEINTDGYIGPDEKWAPNIFIGPDGEHVDAETGKFQATDGKWLVVGVDGYVEQGKWKFYPKTKPPPEPKKKVTGKKGAEKKEDKQGLKKSEATWSCFGSASPKQLSKMGIVGHGQDKKLLLSTLQNMMARGEDVKIPEPKTVPRSGKTRGKHGTTRTRTFVERKKCKHATPSDKGIIAVDGRGNKIYFRLKDYNNRRPKDRMNTLTGQGISVSSFHVPCFHSFISSEVMKKEQYDRLVALAKAAGKGKSEGKSKSDREGGGAHKCTTASTQADYIYVV